ncbi:hypothetical protein BDV18DRAFT_141536 [Aspergillus unguis]
MEVGHQRILAHTFARFYYARQHTILLLGHYLLFYSISLPSSALQILRLGVFHPTWHFISPYRVQGALPRPQQVRHISFSLQTHWYTPSPLIEITAATSLTINCLVWHELHLGYARQGGIYPSQET